jgi:MFS family permease
MRRRWLALLLAAYAVSQASIGLVRPMASYRALEIGLSPAVLGLLAASFSILPLVAALRVGRAADRFGEMPFIFAGAGIMGAASLLLSVAGSGAALFVLFALLGLGHLVITVAAQGLAARGSDERGLDGRFAAFSLAASAGQMAGPAIAGVMGGSGAGDTSRLLVIGGGIALLSALLACLVRPPGAAPAPGPAPAPARLSVILRTPGVWQALLASTAVLSAADILAVYLPALGQERLWSTSAVGLLLALRAASAMGVRLVLGRLAGRIGRTRLLASGMTVAAAALLLAPAAPSLPLAALLLAAAGAGMGVAQPMTMAWMASLAGRGSRTSMLSVRLMGNRVGQVALPILAGSMAALAGAGGVIAASGILIAVGAAASRGAISRRRPSEDAPAQD